MNGGSKRSLFGLSPSRRDVVKGTAALAGAAALSGTIPKASAADEDTLTMLTWPGHADAHVVAPFEEEHGVKVVPKEYVGGEAMLSLLQQSPVGTYDVILTGNAYIEMMRDGGFIEKLDPTDYPIDDFWPEFQQFPTHWLDGDLYSVMVSYGFIGIAYNTQRFTPDDLQSYEALWSDKAKGKVGHFDWYLPSMGVLSIYNGNKEPFDIGEAEFQKLRETLFSLKPQVSGFWAFAGLFGAMTGEDALVVPGIGEWLTILMRKDGLPVDMDDPGRGRIAVDRIAVHREGQQKAGTGEEVHPVYEFARGSRARGHETGLQRLDSEHSGVEEAERGAARGCGHASARVRQAECDRRHPRRKDQHSLPAEATIGRDLERGLDRIQKHLSIA